MSTRSRQQPRRFPAFQFQASAGLTNEKRSSHFHQSLRNHHVFLHRHYVHSSRKCCTLFSSLNDDNEVTLLITDATLIEQSRQRLPWEEEQHYIDSINNNIDNETIHQRWKTMKEMLLNLKVLPPSQQHPDDNNTNQKQQPTIIDADDNIEPSQLLLHNTPQLLRLCPLQIKNTVKNTQSIFNLPPSIFYHESTLLTLSLEDIARGFNMLILQKAKELDFNTTTNNNDGDDGDNIIVNVEECDVDMLECTIENIRKSVVEDIVCTPRILLDAAILIARETEWDFLGGKK